MCWMVAMAVVAAKGLALPDPDIRTTVRGATPSEFSMPSMLQHIGRGRLTEIDALNGALVREATALGIPTPYNEALVALVKGRETNPWCWPASVSVLRGARQSR